MEPGKRAPHTQTPPRSATVRPWSDLSSCAPRRVETPSPDGPADLETFRTRTGRPVCVLQRLLFARCFTPWRGNTRHGRTDKQLAAGPLQVCISPVSLLAQTLCKIREDEEQILLVAPYWATRTWFSELMLFVTAPLWQIPLRKDLLTQRRGTLWHPCLDLWKLYINIEILIKTHLTSFFFYTNFRG